MPKWVDTTVLSDYAECSEDYLYEKTGMIQNRELTPAEQRIAQEHFTMIAGVLPFIGNEQKRSQMIDFLADHQIQAKVLPYRLLALVYCQKVYHLAALLFVPDKRQHSSNHGKAFLGNSLFFLG